MSMKKDVLAVDFGTTNSYVSKCGLDSPKASGIDLDGGRDGMSTAILYRTGKSVLIGEKALEEFGEASAKERESYKLMVQFKPDIAKSGKAREAARDFLAQIIGTAERSNVFLDPAQKQVIFGIPSESSEDFVRTLKDVAFEAGFGVVETRDEPEGALIFHISNNEIPAQKALAGGLVIDFGGGTCDFAIMNRGKVSSSWGDFELGGRLFDDLFFQWFIEQCPDAAAQMERSGDVHFVHSYRCREIKEYFSRSMENDRSSILRKTVEGYGQMQGMSWQEFLRRARVYRLSPVLRSYWESMGVPLGRLAHGRSVDLLEWFRQVLLEGLKGEGAGRQEINYVILTGGSSQWPFVRDIVQVETGVRMDSIIRSSKPYAAIAEGLAALPALKLKFADVRRQLEEQFPAFFAGEIKSLLDRKERAIVDEMANAVVMQLFDAKLKSILEHYRERGGAVIRLKEDLASAVAGEIPQIESGIQNSVVSFCRSLAADVVGTTREWLNANGLRVEMRELFVLNRGLQFRELRLPENYFGTLTDWISRAVVASVLTIFSGGALFLTGGPLGLIPSAILGVAVGGFMLFYGAKKAREKIELVELSPKIIALALSERKISGIREDLRDQISKNISEAFAETRGDMLRQLELTARAEINALSEIQQL
ncbi:MAG: rod shape-determining protein [Xanthomonadales bacterium]|nr:rod shape-determining protein [Xanthomonadales bacterium]